VTTPRLRALGLLLLAAAVAAAAGTAFARMHRPDVIVRGPGVTDVRRLSAYLPNLAGGPGDTDVYELRGAAPGGTFLLLGGTHPQETSGVLAAVLLIENARVTRGRLLVVPQANASGFTHTDPMEGFPATFTVETPGGPRRFRHGMRRANPVHHWPDPEVYVHRPSGEHLSGDEIRNLNRAFPGDPRGSLLERVAWALAEIVRREGVDLVFDLHEAYPEYPVVNVLVAHERAMEVTTLAVLDLQLRGLKMNLMPSPKNLRGLSHRELGDHTPTLAVLAETPNPMMGRLRGRTDERLLIEGRDPFYVRAAGLRRLFVPFDAGGWPLALRVGRQLVALEALAAAYGEKAPARPLVLEDVPAYEALRDRGLGAFLRPPPTGEGR
jgi:hypothetical protein